MGCGESRERHPVPGLSELEAYVYEKQTHIMLQDVSYDQFLSAIKRFGYKNDLNTTHLQAIHKEIKLDYNELTANKNSIFHLFYNDKNFTYNKETERYSVDKLLKIGFLLCQHQSIDTQGVEMWNLLNPKFDATVPQERCIQFVEDLIYISIIIVKRYLTVIGIPLIL